MTVLSLLLAVAATTAVATPVQLNDNVRTAGTLNGGVLRVNLVAALGTWHPNGSAAAGVTVATFGEEGAAPSVPGPLIRAVRGTTVTVTVRNALSSDLLVWGLCSPTAHQACDATTVAAGASREIRFSLTTPGTFYYWGSTSSRTLAGRARVDSQLNGAIVVDPADGGAGDRILIVSALADPRPAGPCGADTGPDPVFAINGASWPHTTRLRYAADQIVRWRVINMSCDQHAMHLHGFHFTVESAGDGTIDRPLGGAERRTVVTEAMAPGRTFTMSWRPARAGNWLFHCHMVGHMSAPAEMLHAGHDIKTHAGMAGLVIGVEITGRPEAGPPPAAPARRFSLVLTEEPNRYGSRPGFRVEFDGIDAPRLDPGPVPGPVLVLRKGEPVEITIVNRMKEPTAIHWHGIEIESYFDGVPGFGGDAHRIAPPVEPGQAFVVRMAPPRAGTFIYHTHWHDEAQLAGGVYGALLVLEPGERYDPATDHIAIIGLNGVLTDGVREPFALNGRAAPAPMTMRAGVPNRLRLINITPNNVALTAFLLDQAEPVRWKLLAKDGATAAAAEARAARQQIAVGETYDFEIDTTGRRDLWLEVRRGNGEWVLQAPVRVR